MTAPKRLFDCLDYQLEHFQIEDMLVAKVEGNWEKFGTKEVKSLVESLSSGLLASGISGNDNSIEGRAKVAIISKNRPEWIMVDLAVQRTGAVLVPLYPTLNINELEFVLNDAQVHIIFVNDKDLLEKVKSIHSNVPSLKEIFSFEKLNECSHWTELLARGSDSDKDKVAEIAATIKSEDLTTIIYTSGTTGEPKGVMLSHQNILSNVWETKDYFPLYKGVRVLSFLPLNHIFEKMVSYVYMFTGASIYYAESMETIGENLKEVKPHMFTTVPRLLEKVYEKIMAKASDLSGIKKALFYWAHDLGRKYDINKNQGFFYDLQLSLANKIIFSKWREALGGEVKLIATGSAACPVKLLRIFTAAGIPILEGYGLTETSPVISVNRMEESGRMFGTVGPVIGDVEVKIEEDGEILCKGPNIMLGYYKKPDLTAEVLKDGWFHTGDIGTMVDNTFLKITDRKKEIFKTSGGKYVAPLPLENKMKESKFIEQLLVLGDGQKFVSALVVPSFSALKDWCKEKGIAYPGDKEIAKNEEIQNLIMGVIERYNKEFNHVEQIKKIELIPEEWTVDSGELTPTLKVKRKVITEKYKDLIEKIYS